EEDTAPPPVEDITQPPLEDIAPPEEDIAPPEEDIALPEEDIAPPEEDIAPPEEDIAPPEEDIAPPEEDITPPEEDAEEPPPVDPCVPDPCDDIPTPYCDGGVLFEPDGTSDCAADGEDFTCTYPAVETDCGALGDECSLGGCIPLIPPPGEGEVVITEMMPEPEFFMNAARWIELRVLADDLRDMGGCSLSDATGASAPIGGELIVEPDEHVVIALGLLDGLVDDFLNPTVVLPGPEDAGGLDLSLEGPEPLRLTCGGVIVDAVDLAIVGNADEVEPAAGTAWQLSAGKHTAVANDDGDNWCSAYLPYGFDSLGTPGVENFGCDTNVDWCRLWEPAIEVTTVGNYFSAYIHIQELGLTDKTKEQVDQIAGLRAEVGYGPDGEIPLTAPEQFNWIECVPEISPQDFIPSNHDRWRAPVIIYLPGLYDLVGRFSLDGGFSWKYCDLDGSGNGYSPAQSGNVYISLD
ncbi:MAG: hypothetical protein VYE15_01520, partial [Myxococcota bacterium]|nr:hypothetical protein [Myxococcota bacterium]